MIRIKLFFLAVVLIPSFCFSQNKVTISGYVKDNSNGEDLIGSTVYIKETKAATTTNVYGFYSLTIPAGEYTLVIQSFGYEKQEFKLKATQNIKQDADMTVETKLLKEVVVTGEKKDKNVTSTEISTVEMDVETIKKIPQVFGEADVIKSIQLLPGVSSVGEGASGFNVRGGNTDQNLVLLDEAPVYNSSHFFGFFSTFNTDAVKDVKLYKGGIPAVYGGRLSSVLDVRQRDGNKKRFAGNGGIGIISSRLTLEAPIVKDKSSFLIAGRRTYGDVLAKPFLETDNTVYFYDLNTKIDYRINDNNKLFLSGYFGRDVFKFGSDFGFNWGNITSTLRWNHVFNDKLFSNYSLVYSNYNYSLGVPDGVNEFEWTSKITTWNAKADFNYYINPDNTLHFGIQSVYYRFSPGNFESKSDGNFNTRELEKEFALEPAIYVSNEQKVNEKLSLNYGLRYSTFHRYGKNSVFQYKEGAPRTEDNIVGTVNYGKGENYKNFFQGLAPRFSARYQINKRSSLKASYNRMYQYIHLVSNTTSATPVDVWTPSGEYIDPAHADQFAVGYFRNFKDNTVELSVETYYKSTKNVLDYKPGADLFLNESLETELLVGKGRSYGLELMLSKKKGKFNGFIAYTLSRTVLKTDNGPTFEEKINNGEWYFANWNKTHDLAISASYKVSKNWEFATNFVFASGRPVTLPVGKWEYEGRTNPVYLDRNNGKIPAYHRLDFSAIHDFPKKKPEQKWESSLVIGLYNIYARKNAYSVYFRQNEDNAQLTEAVRLSIFGSIIPSISYNFKF
ncbi:MAG: TonB-dependent receptor [Cyclobacteriaceae bacterium]